MPAATPGDPFRLADARPQRLTADPLPILDLDAPPAFHVYLLGHDSVADHDIVFTRQQTGGHTIDWNGRIALTYAGEEEFSHRFRAPVVSACRYLSRLDHLVERSSLVYRGGSACADGQAERGWRRWWARPPHALR